MKPKSQRPAPKAAVGRVLVLADGRKPSVLQLLARLRPWLEQRVELHVADDVRAFGALPPGKRGPRPDLVVVLGGDGTILAAVRAFAEAPVPTLGINFGRVGFLTSAEAAHWEAVVDGILDGQQQLEPRMRLQAELRAEGKAPVKVVALNDIVVTRGAFQGMLELSLSPTLEALVVTPICPHSLSHRPIVLEPGAQLELEIKRSSGIATLVVDGQGFFPMQQGERLLLTRHPVPFPLLVQPGLDPYRRLRDRLGWQGSIEGEDPERGGGPLEPGDDGLL